MFLHSLPRAFSYCEFTFRLCNQFLQTTQLEKLDVETLIFPERSWSVSAFGWQTAVDLRVAVFTISDVLTNFLLSLSP